MTFHHFIRPTVSTVLPAFALTLIAAGLLYYSLLCALGGSGDCVRIPFVIQLVVVALLWPWVAAVRFIGVENIAFASILGFAISFIWIFLLACIVRWGIGFIRKK